MQRDDAHPAVPGPVTGILALRPDLLETVKRLVRLVKIVVLVLVFRHSVNSLPAAPEAVRGARAHLVPAAGIVVILIIV